VVHVVDVSDEEVDHPNVGDNDLINDHPKMALMMMFIGMRISPKSILNQLLIQMLSWMKKKMIDI
jgi:hypothetical protein